MRQIAEQTVLELMKHKDKDKKLLHLYTRNAVQPVLLKWTIFPLPNNQIWQGKPCCQEKT